MVCHEMDFLPPPPPSSSDHHHHQNNQYFFHNHHHDQLDQDTSLSILSNSQPDFHGGQAPTMSHHQHHHHHHHQYQGGEYNLQGHHGEEMDDVSDDGSHMVGLGEKKKRLSMEQVKTLEKNFEIGNKLEPERKVQLAKALGLQPRQVAIWFQNRRARWKTKQLEKDYNLLKRQFDALKSDNDSLLSYNKKLHDQLLSLKSGGASGKPPTNPQEGGNEFGSINLNATTKSYCWSNNGSEISSDINLGKAHQEDQSPSSNNNNNKLHFPSSFLPTSLTDLLTSSSSAPKPSSSHHQVHQDETYSGIFAGASSSGGVHAEQPPFWAWAAPDQHHLN